MADDGIVPNIPHRELMLLDPEIEIVRVDIPHIQALGPLPIPALGGCNVIQLAESRSGQGSLLQIQSGRFGQALIKILEDITEIPRLMEIYEGLGLSKEVVVKHRWTEEVKNREREITFARQLNHPNITRILAFISLNGTVEKINAIVMEGSYLGTLEKYTMEGGMEGGRQLPDDVVKLYARQLADALRYCHEENHIVHRDVRPRNIYVHENGQIIKLGNFGYARKESKEPMTANKGDEIYYKAPEMINHDFPLAFYSYPVDVYSYALVLWSISHRGGRPFWDQNRNLFVTHAKFHEYLLESDNNRPPIREDLDPALADVIRRCWVNLRDGLDARPTMGEIIASLR